MVLIGHASTLAANQAKGGGGHLVSEASGRYFIACGRSRAHVIREEPFEAALEAIGCGKCRVLWQRIMVMPIGKG